MGDFNKFKKVMQAHLSEMAKAELFRVDIDKDILWETYLDSFPEGTNKIFRERREYDCQCCKQFIRACGDMVSIVDNKLISIWDVDIGGYYQVVADALSVLVKSKIIKSVFFHRENHLGTDHNLQLLESGKTTTWNHFHFALPDKFVKRGDDVGTAISNTTSGKDVFKRGVTEISIEAVETVLELIEQKSIYRGEENKRTVDLFLKHKKEFILLDDGCQDNYCWSNSVALGGAARVRNTSIGTLLVDISEGMDIDKAVKSFESKVAPTNYKRPTALITKSMITNAQKKVSELGIEDALQRRYAATDDITINNVLFADRIAKKAMNVFDELADDVPVNVSSMKKVDEVGIETFINTILPKAEGVELLLENRHSNNMMSLIAPNEKDAKHIFKWNNNYSWAYNGEVTDSIKERVKSAGGDVTGDLRCSLSWLNCDDLDIHAKEPNGNHIYYSRKHNSSTGGRLDVDMNAGGGTTRTPVENITWPRKEQMEEGIYEIFVHNYCRRETIDVGFDLEIEFGGVIHSFHYDKAVKDGEDVAVAKFEFSMKDGIKFIESLPSSQSSIEVWGVPTQKFQMVSMIMNSPNHWDGEETGNKHWFFILEGCKNDKPARGFFNEFLKESLSEHRKVFEVLGSKMKTEKSDNQLSGLGFSSTQKNHVFCKVTGSFARTIKINF